MSLLDFSTFTIVLGIKRKLSPRNRFSFVCYFWCSVLSKLNLYVILRMSSIIQTDISVLCRFLRNLSIYLSKLSLLSNSKISELIVLSVITSIFSSVLLIVLNSVYNYSFIVNFHGMCTVKLLCYLLKKRVYIIKTYTLIY